MMDKKQLINLLIEAQNCIGCGCGGDYGLCESCDKIYDKIDKVVDNFEG